MKAILYLVRKEIKNSFLDMIRHPARLILYIGLIVLLGFSLFTQGEAKKTRDYLDIRILEGAYFAIMLLISVPSILGGLKSGATFFKMSDVNFLFVSPISPKKILAYGLIKQMAATLLMMVFLLFYGGMTANMFGVAPWQIVALMAGIALLVFIIQIITLLIYSFTCSNQTRIRLVKGCMYAVFCIIAAIILGLFLNGGSNIEALFAAIASPYLTYIPVIGWIKGMVFAIIYSNGIQTIIYAALNLLALVGSILLFVRSNSDYYEDVLQSTETTFEMQKAVKEGRAFNMKASKPAKVTDTGIDRGWGANAFFFKHLRQSKRKSRIPILGTSTLILLAGNIVFAIFLQSIGKAENDPMPIGILMAVCLVASAYVLFFFSAMGDLSMELTKPYIYLVPESSFKKLLWTSLTSILKPVIDAVLIFTILGIYVQAKPLTAVLCALVYASTGFLFMAGNILSQRVLGSMNNKGLIMIVYMVMLAILLSPGITCSAILYVSFPSLSGFFVGLPIVASNVLVSLGVIWACRNLLSTVEFNN